MPPSQCDKKLEHNPNADAQSDVACSGGCEYYCLAAGLAAESVLAITFINVGFDNHITLQSVHVQIFQEGWTSPFSSR